MQQPVVHFFLLQERRLSRHLREAGINPYLAYGLLGIAFVALSNLIFQRTSFARLIYPVIGLIFLDGFRDIDRNDFLRATFSSANYQKIRLIENGLVALPFVLFMLYQQEYLVAMLFLAAGFTLSFFNRRNRWNYVLPTPFYRWPFEFTVGFRTYFPFFIFAYLLAFIAIREDNFNLGVFSLMLTFLACLSFYSRPEPFFYVWNHGGGVPAFFRSKITIALRYSLYASLPILVALILYAPDKIPILLAFELLGMLYVLTSLFGKYAYYPSRINLIQGLMLAFTIIFPPALLAVMPYLYVRAQGNLKSLIP